MACLIELIKPHYPKAGRGRRPHDLEQMLRFYFLQQRFNRSDPQAEDASELTAIHASRIPERWPQPTAVVALS